MQLVADIVNRQNDWNAGPEGGRIGRSVKDSNTGAGCSPWQADQRPARVTWRVGRFGYVFDSGGNGTGVTAEGDDLQRFAKRDKRADQLS